MSPADWIEFNQGCLVAELNEVRSALERHATAATNKLQADESTPKALDTSTNKGASPANQRSALETLCQTFGLSEFERAVLLLCAGVELEAGFPALCAKAAGDPARPWPTFSLALAALPGPHWSALAPSGALRHWRLIEVVAQPNVSRTLSPLRIDERILNFLTGVHHLDERLAGFVEPIPHTHQLVPTQREVAQSIALSWSRAEGELPLVQLCGADEITRRLIAEAACTGSGLNCFALAAESIPTSAGEIEGLIRLWEREAALTTSALYIDLDPIEKSDTRTLALVTRLLERIRSPLLVSATTRQRPLRRAVISHDVRKPTSAEQHEIWRQAVGDEGVGCLNGQLNQIVAQFNLSAPAIHASVSEARATAGEEESLSDALWKASRLQARSRLDDLAQRIDPIAKWADIVLPNAELDQLREVTAHVAHRTTVYESWGFGAVSSRGLGISALFAGTSGTGKTMAAEVLANALNLDLYRIDLSSVVSKYIGETEKNLRRVFDAAEDGGAILFFDEADALFGKRSEVKDSHDRYANIEINYLLQRMESYRGLAVLATNRKGDLDPAFLRRLRFVVNFPFPDAAQRVEIWRRIFPPDTPTNGLDLSQLARLNVAGGSIRNIALNGAFLAADANEPVRMEHLARAAEREYAKLERPLTEIGSGGWL